MTDNRTTDLKPCPFCGGEAEIIQRKVHHSDWFGKNYRTMYRAKCKSCGAAVGKLAACEYYRDESTGDEWGAIVDWNARAERTCERVLYKPTGVFVCSECGAGMPKQLDKYCYLNYCPNCGCRVIGTSQKATSICDSEAVGE